MKNSKPITWQIEIDPVSAPRQVRSHAWKPTKPVLKYRAFKDKLRELTKDNPIVIPAFVNHVHLEFTIVMPKSWSKKKQRAMEGLYHRSKPDIDNLVKAVLDAVCAEDKHVASIRASKRWGYSGQLLLVVS